jgi:hypothetical protein
MSDNFNFNLKVKCAILVPVSINHYIPARYKYAITNAPLAAP